MAKKQKLPGFRRSLEMMRARDPQTAEDGFHCLMEHATTHVHDLIDEARHERDLGVRRWLVELVGEARSEQARAFLIDVLRDRDEGVRLWAAAGLGRLASAEARRALFDAERWEFDTSDETMRFREAVASARGKPAQHSARRTDSE